MSCAEHRLGQGSKGGTLTSAKLFILMLVFRLKVWRLVEVLWLEGRFLSPDPAVPRGHLGTFPIPARNLPDVQRISKAP